MIHHNNNSFNFSMKFRKVIPKNVHGHKCGTRTFLMNPVAIVVTMVVHLCLLVCHKKDR